MVSEPKTVSRGHLVSDSPFIVCPICHEKLQILDSPHLKKHHLSLRQLRSRFPEVPTITLSRLQEIGQKSAQKVKETSLQRYGVGNPYQNPEFQEKFRRTCLERWGVENPSSNLEIRRRRTASNLRKYGVKSPSQLVEVKRKTERTCLERYGHKSPMQNPNVLEKSKGTCILNYGISNPSLSPVVQERISCSLKSIDFEEVIKKRRVTFLQRYGVPHPAMSDDIKEKTKETCLDRYGTSSPFENPIVQQKIRKTCLDRYGVEYFSQSEDFRLKHKKTVLGKSFINVSNSLDYLGLELVDSEYRGAKILHQFRCKSCGALFFQRWNAIQQGARCPFCLPPRRSLPQLVLAEFLLSLGLNVIQDSRSIIAPLELDIVIPDLKVAVEFNGLYWHSEDQLVNRDIDPKFYHLHKTEACEKVGYRLIHIFEDEWVFKQDIVKHRLKSILSKFDGKRIHARECKIKEIDAKTKNEFLETYHIQGQDRSKIKLGAFHGNQLVAVMTFSVGNISKGSKPKLDVWELNRFCVDYHYHIPGIASKLLSHFKRSYPWLEIFSYADRRWSTGNLYKQLGFKFDKCTQVNYWYIKGLERIHRFNLRKRPDEPKDIPEWVLRAKEGYWKVWDCGNLRFVMGCNRP